MKIDEVIKGGFDTVGILYSNLENEKILEDKMILNKHISYTKNGDVSLVFKPSMHIDNGYSLSSLKSTIDEIQLFEETHSLTRLNLKRVDFAIDLKETINENLKLYLLIMECLNVERKGNGVYQTKRPITYDNKQGNYKISSNRCETTIYNCIDKNRIANTRIEQRIKDIRTKDPLKTRMVKEVKKFIIELSTLEKFISIVEDKYIKFLVLEYRKMKGVSFRTFTEFVSWADKENLILTERILKELLNLSGITTRFKKFTYEFRKNRSKSLQFTNKTQMNKLLKEVKSQLKKML